MLAAETSRTWVEVDLDQIVENLSALRSSMAAPVDVLMPVKANAYGHGLVPVSRAVKRAGVWGLGIAGLDEAETLREGGIEGPVVCLMPILPAESRRALELEVTPAVSSWAQGAALSAAAEAVGRVCDVHIDVDTGMGRSGTWDREAATLVTALDELPGLRLDGIFTHFSSADETDRRPTETQLDRFDRLLAELESRGVSLPRVHAANSAAALRFDRATRALIRPGIVVYGTTEEIASDPVATDGRAVDRSPFAPALRWYARVVAVKVLRAGDSVSYNRRYVARGEERIALLAVGYGDGWPYALSNTGTVLLRGQRVPIRGSVCMDLTMVDASAWPDLEVGEVVTLIGDDGAETQTVGELGRAAGLMSYAILTGISSRVPRRYSGGERS